MKLSEEQLQEMGRLKEWLKDESHRLNLLAKSRRSTATSVRKCSKEDLVAASRIASQMMGRKLKPSTLIEAKQSATLDDRVAAKYEDQANNFTSFVASIDALLSHIAEIEAERDAATSRVTALEQENEKLRQEIAGKDAIVAMSSASIRELEFKLSSPAIVTTTGKWCPDVTAMLQKEKQS